MWRGKGNRGEKEKGEEYDPTRTRYLYEESLPLLELFKTGTATQVVEALRVSKKWRRLLNNNALWKELLFHDELHMMLKRISDSWTYHLMPSEECDQDIPTINLYRLAQTFYSFVSERDENLLFSLNESMATLFIIIWYALPRMYLKEDAREYVPRQTSDSSSRTTWLKPMDDTTFERFESTCIVMNVKFMTLYELYRSKHPFCDKSDTKLIPDYYNAMLREILPQMTLDDACVNQAVPYFQLDVRKQQFLSKQYGRVPQFLLVDRRTAPESMFLISEGVPDPRQIGKPTGSIAFGLEITDDMFSFLEEHSRSIVNVSTPYFFFVYSRDSGTTLLGLRKLKNKKYIRMPHVERYWIDVEQAKIRSEIE
jgi:hypothetical protein